MVLRLLAVLCCINLALPPGWCCIVCPVRVEPPAVTKHAGCCDLCGCNDREKPATPEPTPPARCCCYELDWLKPLPPVSTEVDTAQVVFLPLDDAFRAAPRLCLRPDLAIPVPSPPHRILHCVWLC